MAGVEGVSGARLKLPPHGFGEHEVPEMPAYVDSYSKRGNSNQGEQTPVYNQARWGNRRGRGGMNAYLSQTEDSSFMADTRVKLGDQGVFEHLRWTPGADSKGNFGIASLSETKNFAGIPTRGGSLRAGAPKRGDVVERPNAFYENLHPGLATGRLVQTNDNYSGIYDWKKRTPEVQRSNDMLQMREMIEHNPYHINSHAASQAKRSYDEEFMGAQSVGYKAYQDHLGAGHRTPDVLVQETNRYMLNRP